LVNTRYKSILKCLILFGKFSDPSYTSHRKQNPRYITDPMDELLKLFVIYHLIFENVSDQYDCARYLTHLQYLPLIYTIP